MAFCCVLARLGLLLALAQQVETLADADSGTLGEPPEIKVVRQVLCDPGVGELVDVAFGRLREGDGTSLIVSGREGAAVIDEVSGEKLRAVELDSTASEGFPEIPARMIDVDSDGVLEFVRLAANWAGRTSLHRGDGSVLWTHPQPDSDLVVSRTRCADLDGDGHVEFLFLYNASPQVDLVNAGGELIWSRQFDGPRDVRLVERESGEEPGIFIMGREGLVRWSAGRGEGEPIEVPHEGFLNLLEVVSGPGLNDSLLVGVRVSTSDGPLQRYSIVDSGTMTWRRDVEMQDVSRFVGAHTLELPIGRFGWSFAKTRDGVRLVIFDEAGMVAYEDSPLLPGAKKLLPVSGTAFVRGEGGASVVVGCGSEVWEYSISY